MLKENRHQNKIVLVPVFSVYDPGKYLTFGQADQMQISLRVFGIFPGVSLEFGGQHFGLLVIGTFV